MQHVLNGCLVGEWIICCCSDPRRQPDFRRFIEQDENGLKLKEGQYIPQFNFGGAAPLAHRLRLSNEYHSAKSQFLVGVKNFPIRKVAIIAHEGCAYYTEKKLRNGADKEPEFTDLPRIGEEVKVILPTAEEIVLCSARWHHGQLRFKQEHLDMRCASPILTGQF